MNHHHQLMSQEEDRLIHAILMAKEPLDKPVVDRNDEDISRIYELCSHVAGFAIFPPIVRRCLASHVLLVVIAEAGRELITHSEDMDSYCVLIHGKCEQLDSTKKQTIRHYNVGDSFGVCEPTRARVRFEGYMRTLCENCAFLCVARDDFYTILTDESNFPIQEVVRHRDKAERVICVSHYKVNSTQSSALCTDYTSRHPNSYSFPIAKGHVMVKATEERLLTALVDGSDAYDSDYVDDFLLTFRVFMRNDNYVEDHRLPPGMAKLCSSLLIWLNQSTHRDKVVKIVLTWLSSYYHDFEVNSNYSHSFFRDLESKLLRLSMDDQLNLLHNTLSAKSRTRQITISRSSREEHLTFTISGGYDKNCGIFVSQVFDYANNSNNPQKSLRPGDQILEVNSVNFRIIKLADAQKMLNDATHLSLTLKYNPSEFYEMRALPEGRRKSVSKLSVLSDNQDAIKIKLVCNSSPMISSANHQVNVLRVFNAANNDSKYLLIHEETTAREVVMIAVKEFNLANNQIQNNPNRDRTSSLDWALFEVSVVPEAKTIKQRRLPEQMSNLASRAPLRSRFYIKNNNQSSNNYVPTRLDESGDSLFNEITKDCPEDHDLMNLDASLFAKELTLTDFAKFRRIEPQQFVYDTFFEYTSPSQQNKQQNNNHKDGVNNYHDNASISSSTDSSSNEHSDKSTIVIPPDWMTEYTDFASISNREMFWVVNEILRESKRDNRVKIIKKFVSIAKECKKLKNFNSLFAIISGLGHGCVTRLRRTFEKLDSGHKKLLDEMQAIFDPSKNMLNYRKRLSETQPPAIPLFPQIKKDFTFIKENPTYVKESNSFTEEELENTIGRHNHDKTNQDVNSIDQYSVLVNFDKMRLVAKQVRQVTYYSSAPCLEYLLNDSRGYKKMHEEWIMRKRIQEYMNKRLNCDTSEMRKNSFSTNHNCKNSRSQSHDSVDSTSTIDRVGLSRGQPSEQVGHFITYDERELLQLSLRIEPDASSHSNDKQDKGRPDRAGKQPPVSSAQSMNSVNTATSSDNGQPSPTLSKSSSLSSCSSFSSPSAQMRHLHHFPIPSFAYPARSGQINPGMLKFGADSPDKVRKLQSLSEEGVRMKSNNSSSSLIQHQLRHSNDINGSIQRHSSHILPTQLSSIRLTHSISQDLTLQRRLSAESSLISATNSHQQSMIKHHHMDPIKLEPPPPPKNKQAQIWSQQQQQKKHPSTDISPSPTAQTVPPAPSQHPPPLLPPSISPIKPPIAPARSCSSSPNPNQPLIRHLIHRSSPPPPIPAELPPKPLPSVPQGANKTSLQQLQPKESRRTNVNPSSRQIMADQPELGNMQSTTDNRGFCHAQPQYYAARAARTKPTNQQPCSNLQCYHTAFQRQIDGTHGADSDSYSDEGDDSNANLTSVV